MSRTISFRTDTTMCCRMLNSRAITMARAYEKRSSRLEFERC